MGVGVGAGRPVDSISPTQGMGRCQGPPDARIRTKRKRPSTMGTAETSQIVTRRMKRMREDRDAKRRKVSPAEPAAADAGSIEDIQTMPRPNRKPDHAQSDPSEKKRCGLSTGADTNPKGSSAPDSAIPNSRFRY